MLGQINLSLARRTMMRQLGWAADYDGATENLQITNPKNVYSGEYSLKADFANDVVGQAPAGWTTQSGAFQVKNADPSPFSEQGNKYLECTSAGAISIPCNQSTGKWEFDIYKGNDANTIKIAFMNPNTNSYDSSWFYSFRINTAEAVSITKSNTTSPLLTNTGFIANNTWYRIKIERLSNGQFTLSIKGGAFGNNYVPVSTVGGSGTNPFTDTTFSYSNYFVFNGDNGDRVSTITCEHGTGSFDLSGFDRIFHSGNRDFEVQVSLGNELNPDVELNDPSKWSSTVWNILGGVATAGSTNEYLFPNPKIELIPGKLYKVVLEAKRTNNTYNLSMIANGWGQSYSTININSLTDNQATYIYYITANTGVTGLYFFGSNVAFYSLSCKEVKSDWVGSGNHSCYPTGEDKKSGSFCLKMISTGAGDANNCITLPADKFLGAKALDKFTFEGFAKGIGILSSTNLVPNGDFASNLTGWVAITGNHSATWNNGVAEVTATGGYAAATDAFKSLGNIPVTSGKQYKISLSVKSISGNTNFTYQVDGIALSTGVLNTSDYVTLSIVASGNATGIMAFRCGIGGAGVFQIDNIKVQEIIQPSITIAIGNKIKSILAISCLPGMTTNATKAVFNFEATAAELNQGIKVWANQADTIYLDELSFTQHYDLAVNFWAKPSGYSSHGSIYNAFFGKGNDPSALSGYGYGVYYGSENKPIVMVRDNSNVIVSPTSPTAMNLNSWNLFSLIMSDVAASLYQNSALLVTAGTSILGKLTSGGFFIGTDLTPSRIINGQMGEFQVVRFNNIGKSNYDASLYFRNQIPKKYDGGNALVCLHLKFSGPDDATFLKDYSPLGQLVTGINITKADQVRGSYPYFSR